MHPYQEIIDEAKANRSAFLEPYRKKFEDAVTRAAKAQIIIDLIEMEPSHLSEDWIVNETISWLRDCHNCRQYIEDVFIKAPEQHAPSEKQRIDNARAYLLKHRIAGIRKQHDIDGDVEAFVQLVAELDEAGYSEYLGWDLANKSKLDEIRNSMLDFYNNSKDRIAEFVPPYPYYGRDIIETDGKFKLFGE